MCSMSSSFCMRSVTLMKMYQSDQMQWGDGFVPVYSFISRRGGPTTKTIILLLYCFMFIRLDNLIFVTYSYYVYL